MILEILVVCEEKKKELFESYRLKTKNLFQAFDFLADLFNFIWAAAALKSVLFLL